MGRIAVLFLSTPTFARKKLSTNGVWIKIEINARNLAELYNMARNRWKGDWRRARRGEEELEDLKRHRFNFEGGFSVELLSWIVLFLRLPGPLLGFLFVSDHNEINFIPSCDDLDVYCDGCLYVIDRVLRKRIKITFTSK